MALRLSRSNDSILGNPRNGVKPMALRLSRFSSAISASPPTPLQGERGAISLVALWGGAKDGMVSNSVFRPLVLPV